MPNDVTQILQATAGGDRAAAAQLLPAVYDELRNLAARMMAAANRGQTLFVQYLDGRRQAGPLDGFVIQVGLDIVGRRTLEQITGVRDSGDPH